MRLPLAERGLITGRGWASFRSMGPRSRVWASTGRAWASTHATTAGKHAHKWFRRHHEAGLRGWAKMAGWALVALMVLAGADVVLGTPGASEIRNLNHMPEATKVYDVNGKLAFTVFKERRIAVPLSEVSPNVIHAVLAIEDQRFYKHNGVDVWRIGGALIANIRNTDRVQGGSTITQQLARKSFLTDDKTIRRKLKEAFLAARIEEQFTKDQILETYLNKVYFGDGYYGIEAAARGYFGKSAKTLDVAEAALLAGLIQAPSSYAPTEHMDRARARRGVVLRQMVEAGYLDQPTATKLNNSPVTLVDGFEHEKTGQYFKNHLTRVLVEQFGWEVLSQGGLKVYATIDADMQAAAEDAVARGLAAVEKSGSFRHARRGDPKTVARGRAPAYLQSALVAMDPTTGEVRAMVGGRDFNESQFNRAVQSKRQAGSAFKPFVYAAALESGFTPSTVLTGLDEPVNIPGGTWLPDDGHSTATSMTVRAALRVSSNRAAVKMLREIGISRAVVYAKKLGLDAPPVPALVLGAGDVTVLSIAAAYGAFANGGMLREPMFIRRVEDAHGRVLFSGGSKATPAITPETAFLMSQMLADAMNAGTGYRAREAGFRFPAAGKTGTTNDYRDAWFIGYTPALVTSVWVGFDDPRTIAPGGYAGQLAAPIWGRFMKNAVKRDAGWIRRPEGIVTVEICRVSGGRATDMCRRAPAITQTGEVLEGPSVAAEYFKRGNEPADCPIHSAGGTQRSITVPEPFPGAVVAPATTPAPAVEPAKKPSLLKRLFGRGGGGA